MNRTQFQASAYHTKTKNGTRTIRELSLYPKVPAGWPSRAVRRAVTKGNEHRLPAPWREVLMLNPTLRQAMFLL